jgi:hypothetical protein
MNGAAGIRLRHGFSREEIMGMMVRVAGLVILMSFGVWAGQQSGSQEKPKETPKETPKDTPAAAASPVADG